MPPDESPIPSRSGGAPSHFGLLLLCFFLSGLAALIYQTAWTRQFAFVFGTSELAVASVLAAYMGGLALGAAVIGRIAPRIRRPVLVYGLLELAIGIAALAVPFGVGLATDLYLTVFSSQGAPGDEGGLLSALFYLACSFAILLVPTSLMGATLPLLARHAVRRDEEIGSRIAQLYAMNTAGAVVGTVLTAFLLLPALGLSLTVWIAVAANGVVFAAAAALARRAPPVEGYGGAAREIDPRDPNRWILPIVAISGAVSFSYEVLWTRLLGQVLGGSVYAFATMLATFLTGIAVGSWLASGRASSDRQRAASSFSWAQVGAGALSLAAYFAIDSTPAWIESVAVRGDARLLLDVAVSAAILLPGSLCIGATFPLAVRILARSQAEAGPASARVYAWNTVGAIVGAVGAGFFLIPAVGFAWTIAIAVATNAFLALATSLRARPRPRLALAGAMAVLLVLALTRPEPPWRLLRTNAVTSRMKTGKILYFGVGRGASVMLMTASGGWSLSSNGLAEAVIGKPGVRVGRFPIVRWLSNLPAWGRPDARSILVVGFGGGLAVEAVPPNFEKIDVVEIEAEMVRACEVIAAARLSDPLSDPRVELIINDARSALLLTKERYDTIVSQPSHPWTASASHLYTREFFELVEDHLADDGVFVQWMGLRFIDEALLKTLIATLQDVFPYVRVYRPAPSGLLFSASSAPFEPEQLASAVIGLDPRVPAELGIHGGVDIVAHMVLDEEGARAFARGAPISTDDRNLLQMNSPAIARTYRIFDPAPVLAAFDPLGRAELAWDRSYLIRRMLATGLVVRAERLAVAATDPAELQLGLGLMARDRGDRKIALRHFQRALSADPSNAEAQIALLQLLHASGRRSQDQLLHGIGHEPIASVRLVAKAWELERHKEWQALGNLEGELAAIAVRDPAFGPATRLRARWRLEAGGPENARQALTLLDGMFAIGGSLGDMVLRARAAGQAGYGAGTVSSLEDVLRRARRSPSHRRVLQDALRMLEALPKELIPDGQRRAIRRRLLARLR